MKQQAATLELERLEAFVGVWNTEGEVAATAAAPPAKFKAVDTYEWLAGGHFLLHWFEANVPDGELRGLEVMGYSRETDAHFARSFDSVGNETAMQGRLTADGWRFIGEGAALPAIFAMTAKYLRAPGSGSRARTLPGSVG